MKLTKLHQCDTSNLVKTTLLINDDFLKVQKFFNNDIKISVVRSDINQTSIQHVYFIYQDGYRSSAVSSFSQERMYCSIHNINQQIYNDNGECRAVVLIIETAASSLDEEKIPAFQNNDSLGPHRFVTICMSHELTKSFYISTTVDIKYEKLIVLNKKGPIFIDESTFVLKNPIYSHIINAFDYINSWNEHANEKEPSLFDTFYEGVCVYRGIGRRKDFVKAKNIFTDIYNRWDDDNNIYIFDSAFFLGELLFKEFEKSKKDLNSLNLCIKYLKDALYGEYAADAYYRLGFIYSDTKYVDGDDTNDAPYNFIGYLICSALLGSFVAISGIKECLKFMPFYDEEGKLFKGKKLEEKRTEYITNLELASSGDIDSIVEAISPFEWTEIYGNHDEFIWRYLRDKLRNKNVPLDLYFYYTNFLWFYDWSIYDKTHEYETIEIINENFIYNVLTNIYENPSNMLNDIWKCGSSDVVRDIFRAYDKMLKIDLYDQYSTLAKIFDELNNNLPLLIETN